MSKNPPQSAIGADLLPRLDARRDFRSHDGVRWYMSTEPDADCAAAAAEIRRLLAEVERLTKALNWA